MTIGSLKKAFRRTGGERHFGEVWAGVRSGRPQAGVGANQAGLPGYPPAIPGAGHEDCRCVVRAEPRKLETAAARPAVLRAQAVARRWGEIPAYGGGWAVAAILAGVAILGSLRIITGWW